MSLSPIAAICRRPEAEQVQTRLHSAIAHPAQADVLWLTWVQWRALGREALCRETGLSPWEVADRLRRLRVAGVAILSWSEERELFARGRFHTDWI